MVRTTKASLIAVFFLQLIAATSGARKAHPLRHLILPSETRSFSPCPGPQLKKLFGVLADTAPPVITALWPVLLPDPPSPHVPPRPWRLRPAPCPPVPPATAPIASHHSAS